MKDARAKLKVKKVQPNPGELKNTDKTCAICREEMEANSTRKLPCNHIFHRNCLQKWILRHPTCPICRLDLVARLPGQQQEIRQNFSTSEGRSKTLLRLMDCFRFHLKLVSIIYYYKSSYILRRTQNLAKSLPNF